MNRIFLPIILFGFIPGLNIRDGRFILSQWILIAIIVCYLKNIWIRAFVLYLLARSIMSFYTSGYVSASQDFMAIFIGALFFNFLSEKIHIKPALNVLCFIALLQATFMFLQCIGVWIAYYPNGLHPIGSYLNKWIIITGPGFGNFPGLADNSNMASALLALCLPAFFRKNLTLFIPIIFAALILNVGHNEGALAPIMVITIIMVFLKNRTLGTFLFFMLVLMLLQVNTNGRLDIYNFIIKKVLPKHWIWGWGLGQFREQFWRLPDIYEQFHNYRWIEAHNEYLQLWVECGIGALLLLFGIIASTFNKLWSIRNNKYAFICFSGILIAILNSSVNFLFHTPYCLVAIVYLAMVEKQTERGRYV